MIHISDLKKYIRCPLLYLKELTTQKLEHPSFVRLDEKIIDLVSCKLGVTDPFIGETGDSTTRTIEALQTYDWLVRARFEYQGLRIKAPFLHRTAQGWDIYFIYTGLYPHADDTIFYNAALWVIQNCGVKIGEVRILHLNAKYERGEELDPDALFIITDSFYNAHNNPTLPIEETLAKKQMDFSSILKEMQEATEKELPEPLRTVRCAGRRKCPYYDECFSFEIKEPDNSVLHLVNSQHRYDMYKKGLRTLKQVDLDLLEGSRMQYAQIRADENGGLYADQYALRSWLKNISYPIAFLDFEWETFAVPPYKGMHPYDVLPFEYSLHIMQKDGTVTHKVYLNVHDDRRDMAENLVRDIPKNGSIIAYNAMGAEMIRIQEFADQFSDLKISLENINHRMEDMQLPFITGAVYDVRMRGSWSLKSIMAMMDDPGYKDLDISQGMDAVYQWRHLDYNDGTSVEEKAKIVEDLKRYCGMDSYAMTVVYKWLNEIAFKE